jgi:hypothetical protein
MGIVEYHNEHLLIHSHIITYGNCADTAITEMIRDEIETMWNEPGSLINMHGESLKIVFRITAELSPAITQTTINENNDPRNNYFRIEELVHGKISFVDGVGSNSGYFKLENLYKGSTTAAHEYGHTLGLAHPHDLDYRGKGVPGIMYPRGTWVNAEFQYNIYATAGDSDNGGTMHPKYRKVLKQDIEHLKLDKLELKNGLAILGDFTNIWHADHRNLSPADFIEPGIRG